MNYSEEQPIAESVNAHLMTRLRKPTMSHVCSFLTSRRAVTRFLLGTGSQVAQTRIATSMLNSSECSIATSSETLSTSFFENGGMKRPCPRPDDALIGRQLSVDPWHTFRPITHAAHTTALGSLEHVRTTSMAPATSWCLPFRRDGFLRKEHRCSSGPKDFQVNLAYPDQQVKRF